MQFWSSAFLKLATDHKDYWRARLVSYILLTAIMLFAILTVINAIYFKHGSIVMIDAAGFIVTVSIYLHFRKYANIDFSCWATTIFCAFLLMLFVVLVGGYAHSIFWATLIPPIAFFLIGSKWGTIISAICFSICIYLVYLQTLSNEAITFTTGALLNVIEVCISHLFLYRFYERARSSAYNQLALRNQEILALSETDKLTQLFNRDKLESALLTITQYSAEHKQPLSAMLIDIDHFKQINDDHGHLAGDKVLAEVAAELSSMMRSSDFLARWGGEEFMIILKNTELDTAINRAERLRIQVASKTFAAQKLTISIGVGSYRPFESTDEFFERIDKSLYQAKQDGRNMTVAFKP